MELVTVHLPAEFLHGLDDLVRMQKYPNRSEAIRVAIRDLLKDELWTQSMNLNKGTKVERVTS
jgi:antitoxin ParD1/3/4